MRQRFAIIFGLLIIITQAMSQEKVTFASGDGIRVTGDLYVVKPDADYILLCHQARFSRGEYQETAKKLNTLGYNCLAIDLRSGDQCNGVPNETAAEARKAGRPTEYLDAEQDILSALGFLKSRGVRPVVLLGSSYSASLALKIGKEHPMVKAVVAFSPGEYFGDRLHLSSAIEGFSRPVFLTSSKKEAPAVKKLAEHIRPQALVQFVPETEGEHGSKALWSENNGNSAYWAALKAFLEKIRG